LPARLREGMAKVRAQTQGAASDQNVFQVYAAGKMERRNYR
jgi:hypothetical protein